MLVYQAVICVLAGIGVATVLGWVREWLEKRSDEPVNLHEVYCASGDPCAGCESEMDYR